MMDQSKDLGYRKGMYGSGCDSEEHSTRRRNVVLPSGVGDEDGSWNLRSPKRSRIVNLRHSMNKTGRCPD